jgi:hypothetical protein
MTCSDVEGDGIWWCCQGDGIKFRAEIMYTAGLNGRVKFEDIGAGIRRFNHSSAWHRRIVWGVEVV